MNAITLIQSNGAWLASYSGPHAEMIFDLFGTYELQTPFPAAMPVRAIVAALAERNPGVKFGYVEVR